MTLTATYDAALSRVRLTATGATHAEDTFTRVTSNGWGTADTGQVWTVTGGTLAGYANAGDAGRQQHAAVNTQAHSLLDVGATDVSVSADVLVTNQPTGAPYTLWLAVRAADTSNYYAAQLNITPGGATSIGLFKRASGALIPLGSTTIGAHVSGSWRRIVADVSGSTLRAKAWMRDSATDPGWQITVTDTDLTAGTQVGLFSRLETGNTNTLPVNFYWDNLAAAPAAVLLERSTDQVRWTTVRGGADLSTQAGAASLDDYEFSPDVTNYYRLTGAGSGMNTSITPSLAGTVWLKSIANPFLNRPIVVQDYSDVDQPARAGVFDVVGRSRPVAVNGVRGSERWTLDVLTETPTEAHDLAVMLAAGDVLLVHVPAAIDMPGGYVTVGDVRRARAARTSIRRVFSLPLVAVDAPGPDVVGATSTCQAIVNAFATCADLLAAFATCADVVEYVATPADVIT